MVKQTALKKGVFFILLSAFSFALMSVFIREVGDLPAAQKALFRNSVSFLFAAVMVKRGRSENTAEKKHNWRQLLLRSVCGTIGVVANFYAISRLPLGDSNSLNKLSPFFTILASALILKESVKPYQLFGLGIAFTGALLILKPTAIGLSLAHIVAIIGAIAAGFAYTYVRQLRLLGEQGAYIVFFFSAFSILTLIGPVLFKYQAMTSRQLILLLLAGVAASLGQLGVTEAYKYAPARAISIYNYA
ncbi:MAG: DMT family transporter [Eubacteriales bacterium]|nr:DMT family transporter [Eubacteriales bacterium]